jgi:hypothetical protein
MPVVSEESPRKRGRGLWPLWVAVGVLAVLLVGLLPLTEYQGGFGSVTVAFYRQPTSYVAHGYRHGGIQSAHVHWLRIGSWHWVIWTTQ